MTEEIKSRLEQIRAGKVPEGYCCKWGIMPEIWRYEPLSKLYSKSTKKNIGNAVSVAFTNSAVYGIIPQRDYFEKDIANSENTDGYYVVQPDDYIYNPRISESAPYGPFSKNNTGTIGIVSPLYTVLTPKDEYKDSKYLQYFFASTQWYKYAYSIANYGARFDRMNITDTDLLALPVVLPSASEQQKIAEILVQCDKVITLKKERIEEEKKRKKWIMDKLICNSKQSKGWTHAVLGDYLLGLNAGTSVRSYSDDDGDQKENVSNNFFVLKTSAISNGTFDENEKKPVITEDYSRVSCPLRKNTLVISRMNTPALVGACAYCNIESNTIFLPDRLWQAQSKNGESLLWLHYLLNTDYYQVKICLLASGTSNSMKNIAKEDMLRLNISVPNQEERTRIERILAHYDKLICLCEQELLGWKQKKKALMQLLLTGIVRVK